ncbi:LytTR family DNA-binding domain-containing protein [Tianweitania sediminis]|uniref:LytTR family transcriptional regulator n=1 Tax=Tianweitania sediminis TaxID=1502156 RepID=A0A8J7R255_9HYPH|nr:LytTR family transcriptional regulator [Tianweitania sediminis]
MNGGALQFTLREWRDHFSEPLTWVIAGLVGSVLGLAGPFGTYHDFSPVELIAYWLAVTVSTYAVGLFFVALVINWGQARNWPNAPCVLLGGLAAGPPVTLVVLAVNAFAYGFGHQGTMRPLTLLGYCTAIALGVATAFTLLRRKQPDLLSSATEPVTGKSEAAPAALPRILQRLPHPQRGRLLALSVQDHYTQVVTDRGKPLVLIRLSDAISETAGVEGLQIHPSHWVAAHAVKRVLSRDGRMELELENGDVLPVSRSYAPAVRKAGFGS